MATVKPEDRYREAFFSRVQKECRKLGINCSMCYDKIHVYTKFEDFYFVPNQEKIVLYHRNTQKEKNGHYNYHIQEGCNARTPEGIARYVAAHTDYRYNPDGTYRSSYLIKKENQKHPEKRSVTPNNNAKKTKHHEWFNRFKHTFSDLCEEKGYKLVHNNNCLNIHTYCEVFCFEITYDGIVARSKKCKSLSIKDTYNKPFDITIYPEVLMDFIEEKITIRDEAGYINAYFKYAKSQCPSQWKMELEKNRVYIYTEDKTFYFDISSTEPIKLYEYGYKESVQTFAHNINPNLLMQQLRVYTKQLKEEADVRKTKKRFWKNFNWRRILIPATIVLGAISLLLAFFYFS